MTTSAGTWGRRRGGIPGVFGQPGELGQAKSHLFGRSGNLKLQSSGGGVTLGEPRRQFGDASLINLPGAFIHAALSHPAIRIL